MDPRGNPVVDPSKLDFEAVTNLLPRQATFNTRRLSDKEYLPDLESKIREVCEASLPKVVEMKKRKEEELRKLVEKVKINAKLAAEEDQKAEEEQKKKEEPVLKEIDEKIENLKLVSDDGAGDEKKEELKHKETAEDTEVPITEVLIGTTDCEIANWSNLAHGGEEEVAGPWFG
ncbi:protein MNN4-like [Helianthus annuus]|uniref:protein MNN4-like n=1 Tax=Helianthus annuus TaxID=4232 RepID=UPI000B8F28E2|nr:protein MNN4-like [Helianthus annuus]